MFEISIKACFCGAHRLIGYQGQCANLHGHNWEVEIFLGASGTNRLGMLIDFKLLKELLHDVLAGMDHKDLNGLPMFKKDNPTSENIARYIFCQIAPKVKLAKCRLERVRVSETAGTAAYYSRR